MKFGHTGICKSSNKLILGVGDRKRTVQGVLMILFECENRSYERFVHSSRFLTDTSCCISLMNSLVVSLGISLDHLHLLIKNLLKSVRFISVCQQLSHIGPQILIRTASFHPLQQNSQHIVLCFLPILLQIYYHLLDCYKIILMIPVELLTAVKTSQPSIVTEAVCIKTNELVIHVLVVLLPALYFCVFGHRPTINITTLKPYFFALGCILTLFGRNKWKYYHYFVITTHTIPSRTLPSGFTFISLISSPFLQQQQRQTNRKTTTATTAPTISLVPLVTTQGQEQQQELQQGSAEVAQSQGQNPQQLQQLLGQVQSWQLIFKLDQITF